MSGAYPWTFVLESNDEQPHTLPPASTNTKPVIPPLKITPASNSPPSSSLSKSIPLRNNEGSKKSKAKVTKWKFSGTKSKVHKVGVHFDKHSQYMGNWSGADEESTPSPTSSPNPAITATSPPEIQVRPRSQIRKSMKKAANRSSAPADMAFLTKANRNRNSLSRLSIAAFGSPPTSNTTSPLQSPRYNPTSPLQSPRYNPTSPLQSPRYNTTSPRYSTNSPRFNTTSPRYIQNQSSPVVLQSQTPVLYSNEQPTLVQNFTSNPPSNTQVTRNSNVNSRFIPEPLHRSISMPSGMDRNYQGDIYSQYVNSTTTSNDFAHDDFETLLDSQHYQDGIKIVQPNYYRRVSFSEDSRIDSPGSPMQMSPQIHSSNQVRSSSPGMFTGSPNSQMYYSYEQTQGYHHSGNSMQHLHESSMQHPNYSPFGGNM